MTVLEVAPLRWAQVKRALLTAVAAVLFAVGWSASQTVRAIAALLFTLGFTASWCFAAVKVGWQAGQRRGSA